MFSVYRIWCRRSKADRLNLLLLSTLNMRLNQKGHWKSSAAGISGVRLVSIEPQAVQQLDDAVVHPA